VVDLWGGRWDFPIDLRNQLLDRSDALMATRKKKAKILQGFNDLDGWAIGAVQWRDPTLSTEPLTANDAANASVQDDIATKFTFGFWRRDSKGDYLVYSEICSVNGEVQFEQRTGILKELVQNAIDFRPDKE